MVRKGCSDFIRELKKTDGVNKVTLTTNGILLSKDLVKLAEAGVDGINISLDFMDQEKYKKITGFDGYKQVISVTVSYTHLDVYKRQAKDVGCIL